MPKTTEILYLSQADVAAAGPAMADIIDALQTAFAEKGGGRTEIPPKPGVHPGGGDNGKQTASLSHADFSPENVLRESSDGLQIAAVSR